MKHFPPARRAAFSRSGVARWLLWLSAPAIGLASLRYLALPIEQAMPDFAHHAHGRPLAFYAHVLLAGLALTLLPLQLSRRIRTERRGLHRWSERASVAAMLGGGLSGLALAVHAQSGFAGQSGFALLSVLWIGAAGLGLAAALRRDFAAHRAWMIRGAAMTLAAVSLRLQLPVAFAMGAEYDQAVAAIAWTCWVPNLLLAEWLLRRGRAPRGAAMA